MSFPVERPRRLRANKILRESIAETRWSLDQLIQPVFVVEQGAGSGEAREEIPSMPGQFRYSPDGLSAYVSSLVGLGVRKILLFGIPNNKDAEGSSAHDPDGIVQRSVRSLKAEFGCDLFVVTDVCLCEYTDHGHCGIIKDNSVDNDLTLPVLSKTAVSHAQAGADLIAPSDMMDGRVKAIREGLDLGGFSSTPVLSYAVKYASAFYGPFREAADSAPQFGDRRGYQMDPRNQREAIREVLLDIEDGADMVMVKPGLPYLDIISRVRDAVQVPVVSYSVSGEYSMIKAAAANGWLDEDRVVKESLTSLFRAGSDLVITYFAEDIARNEE